jgi:ABC-type branched-subunit amino acid transport system substrate-binding protein
MRKMPATYSARPPLAVALAALALAAGCGGDDKDAPRGDGSVAVYSSVPRQGVLARQGAAVAAGQRLALEDARGRAGGRRVRLVELDSAGSPDEPWDPAEIESNAHRAGDDPAAVAYLGEVGLGGSAVSVPVTNAQGLLQVSAGDPLPSLTQPDPGGGGEIPARYYPEGNRTFLRLVPHGGVEAGVLVEWARELGADSVVIVRDGGVLGSEVASWALEAADRAGVAAEVERASEGADDYEDLAEDITKDRPGAVILTMPAGEDAGKVVLALRAALPSTPILASSAIAPGPPPGVHYLTPHLPQGEYPAGGRRIVRRIARGPRGDLGVETLYGYESMRLVLAAIARARPRGEEDRAAVIRAATDLRGVNGAFGSYSLIPGGDVATSVFATYRATPAAPRTLGLRSAEAGSPPP